MRRPTSQGVRSRITQRSVLVVVIVDAVVGRCPAVALSIVCSFCVVVVMMMVRLVNVLVIVVVCFVEVWIGPCVF